MRGQGLCDGDRPGGRGGTVGPAGRGRVGPGGAGWGRHCSVVNREVARCGGRAGYRAAAALCRQRARWPQPHRLGAYPRLHDAVAAGLARDWSPRQGLQ